MIILLFLTAMVAIIMLRTLNKDIAMYNEEDLKEEQEDTTGWKLVHGDVFRPPKLGGLLSILVGSGVQFSLMVAATGCVFLELFGEFLAVVSRMLLVLLRSLCRVWHFESVVPRRFDFILALPLRVHGSFCRLLQCPTIQSV
jgi:hypothetical protein